MNNSKSELNPYYVLGKLLDKNNGVDYDKISEFVEHYLKIGQNEGEKPNDVLMRIKNFTMDLNDALLSSCIKIQTNLPKAKTDDPTNERVRIKEAAIIYGVSDATIRNWINDKENPLDSLNPSNQRQTTVLLSDLHKYAMARGKSKK